MQLKKDDIISDGENYYSIFCVLGSVIYVKHVSNVKNSPVYELEEVLKHYRKVEIIGDKKHERK